MAYANGVKFVAVSVGTVDFVVAAAALGFQTPGAAGVPNGYAGSYRAESTDLSQWEYGTTVLTITGGTVYTFTRVVVGNSLGTTAKINFTAAPAVLLSASAEDLASASNLTSGALPDARLSNVVTAGSVGSSSAIPVLTYDAKGRITAVSTAGLTDHGLVSIVHYSGSQTITIPTGATRCFIEMVASGGGSSGSKFIGCIFIGLGCHGSSGAALEAYVTGLTGGNTFTYTEGAVGTAGASTPTSGGDAGNSTLVSVSPSFTLTCPGGKGGTTSAPGVGASVATGGDLNWGSTAGSGALEGLPSSPARGWGLLPAVAFNVQAPVSLGYGAAGIGSKVSAGAAGRPGLSGRLRITWYY